MHFIAVCSFSYFYIATVASLPLIDGVGLLRALVVIVFRVAAGCASSAAVLS